MLRNLIVVTCYAVALTGSLTTTGPEPTLDRDGPVQTSDVTRGLAARFLIDEAARNAVGTNSEALCRAACSEQALGSFALAATTTSARPGTHGAG